VGVVRDNPKPKDNPKVDRLQKTRASRPYEGTTSEFFPQLPAPKTRILVINNLYREYGKRRLDTCVPAIPEIPVKLQSRSNTAERKKGNV
jgi:hypothetical protein